MTGKQGIEVLFSLKSCLVGVEGIKYERLSGRGIMILSAEAVRAKHYESQHMSVAADIAEGSFILRDIESVDRIKSQDALEGEVLRGIKVVYQLVPYISCETA